MTPREVFNELTPRQRAALALMPAGGDHYRPRDPVAHETIAKIAKRYSGDVVERVTGSWFYYLRPLGREVRELIDQKGNQA